MNAPRCPICQAPLATGLRAPLFPFCTQKCKLVDLSRWLDGNYAIIEPIGGGMDDADAAWVNLPELGLDDENEQ